MSNATGLPNPLYVCFPGLQNYFVDKDTAQANSAGYAKFYRDVARSTKKNVYQQVQLVDGTYQFNVLTNPVPLNSDGTFGDGLGNDINVYAFPYVNDSPPNTDNPGDLDLYYVEVYNSGGVLQFTREAQPPNVDEVGQSSSFEDSDNLITNPQFTTIVFNPLPSTNSNQFSVSGTGTSTRIAPGWFVVTNGTGSFTVQQVTNSNTGVVSNPPYFLDITSTGITSITLRQNIFRSPQLMYGGFVSGSFVAAGVGATKTVAISMSFNTSPGSNYLLCSGTTNADGSYAFIGDVQPIDGVENTSAAGDVFINISFPVGSHIRITSIQFAQVQEDGLPLPFIQQSTPRQIDHTFHYWQPFLNYKPVASYLTAWDFPLNPRQWGSSVGPITIGSANKAFYAWDQTIVFQTVDNSIAVRSTSTPGGFISLQPNTATQTAIIQYLDGSDAVDLLITGATSNLLSAQFNGTCGSANTTITITLWWSASAPPTMSIVNGIPQGSVFFTGLDANGRPTGVSGAWNEITNTYGQATFTCVGNGTLQNFGFTGFNPGGAYLTARYFAIVVGTGSVNTPNTVGIKSVSVIPGSIPTQPGFLSSDSVLKKCQYYYETSYLPTVTPGTPATPSNYFSPLVVIGTQTFSLGFGNQFLQTKRNDLATAGQLIIYSPNTGTSNKVYYNSADNTHFADLTVVQIPPGNFDNTDGVVNRNGFSYLTTITTPLYSGGTVEAAWFTWHYVADARIGVY